MQKSLPAIKVSIQMWFRMCIAALLANLVLKVYRGCSERIYSFSPSIDVDSTWIPVKSYIESVMKVKDTDDETLYFSEYNQMI